MDRMCANTTGETTTWQAAVVSRFFVRAAQDVRLHRGASGPERRDLEGGTGYGKAVAIARFSIRRARVLKAASLLLPWRNACSAQGVGVSNAAT